MRRLRAPSPISVVVACVVALGVPLASCGGSDTAPAPIAPTAKRGPFVPDGPRGHAVVWAAGDGADGGPGARAVTALIARGRPDLFLYLGDVYPEGDAEGFAKSYAPTFGRLAAKTAPTPGNHDWADHAHGYTPYWTRRRGVRAPAYYSFRAAGWQLISLNTEIPMGAGSRQLAWLRGQLRGTGNCRIAFWHRPRYSAGVVHGDNPMVAPLWNAVRGHARLVLTGHEHNMQRMRPRDGLVEVVSGAGGHSFYGLRRSARGLAFGRANEFGALRLDLRPGVARLSFESISGRTLDRSSVACRRR